MNMKISQWSTDQAWTIYRFLEQLQQEIFRHHKIGITVHKYREQKLEEYAEHVARMSEEERVEEGVWLEPDEPEDNPF